MSRVLIVTNDFPPRKGGIEAFVSALADRFGEGDVVVYTSREPGDAEYDAALPYPVIRDRTRMLLPTRRVRRATMAALREHGCDRVLIGSSAPLGLLADALRAAGAERVVAISHGHEVWWSRLPVTRQLLRAIATRVDVLTYISAWCRDQQARVFAPEMRAKQLRMPPGVDSARFSPGCGGIAVRERLGLASDAPVVVSAARLVKRKGQDMLLRAWPAVLRRVPGARLVIVGGGPNAKSLRRLAARLGVDTSVVFTGPVAWSDIPPYFDAATVFAMPSRTRLLGLEPEGLGIVFLEAASCEKPVIVGDSGGAPDAVDDGVTGYVVDPRDPDEIAERIVELLENPERAREMGVRGRRRALDGWQWDQIAATCKEYLGMA